MPSPMIRLRQKNAIDVERRNVAMSMAHEDHINTGHFIRNRYRLVFMWQLSWTYFTRTQILTQAHVHGDNDYVDLLLLTQNRDPLAGLADRRVKFQACIVWWIVPVRNAGSCEAENTDFHSRKLFDDVWLVMGFLRCYFVSVGRQPGKLCFTARFLQNLETKVVLVISNCHCIVVE